MDEQLDAAGQTPGHRSEPAPPADRPAPARFRVITERMPDGRAIHYYAWPPEADLERGGDRVE